MKKPLALVLALLLSLCTLTACNKKENVTLDTVRVMTLNGTTGFGMARLITAESTAQSYIFTVEKDPETALKSLINGSVDICALPTNAAAKVYNRTNGEIVLLALNTRGVLYLVANAARVAVPESLSDLSGKTVYCPQSPSYIVNTILDKANIEGITLDTSYAQPAALQKALLAGEVDYAILPEPMVTVATAQKGNAEVALKAAIDLTKEWDKYLPVGSLVQGCVVARKAFLEQYPEAVATFLAEYEDSVSYAVEHPKETAEMIITAGILESNAAIAEKALPNCNLCFITGVEMKLAMNAFLAAVPLAEIGDALPADDFYYNAK